MARDFSRPAVAVVTAVGVVVSGPRSVSAEIGMRTLHVSAPRDGSPHRHVLANRGRPRLSPVETTVTCRVRTWLPAGIAVIGSGRSQPLDGFDASEPCYHRAIQRDAADRPPSGGPEVAANGLERSTPRAVRQTLVILRIGV